MQAIGSEGTSWRSYLPTKELCYFGQVTCLWSSVSLSVKCTGLNQVFSKIPSSSKMLSFSISNSARQAVIKRQSNSVLIQPSGQEVLLSSYRQTPHCVGPSLPNPSEAQCTSAQCNLGFSFRVGMCACMCVHCVCMWCVCTCVRVHVWGVCVYWEKGEWWKP